MCRRRVALGRTDQCAGELRPRHHWRRLCTNGATLTRAESPTHRDFVQLPSLHTGEQSGDSTAPGLYIKGRAAFARWAISHEGCHRRSTDGNTASVSNQSRAPARLKERDAEGEVSATNSQAPAAASSKRTRDLADDRAASYTGGAPPCAPTHAKMAQDGRTGLLFDHFHHSGGRPLGPLLFDGDLIPHPRQAEAVGGPAAPPRLAGRPSGRAA